MKQIIRNSILMATSAIALAAVPSAAQSPATTADGEWLSLSGTVDTVSGENFVLDYGQSNITVEMDDYDWYDENSLMVGDEVTVTGRMDNDFFQARRIEASSVYVDSIHTRFYANAADEEDFLPAADGPIAGDTGVILTGTVQTIEDGEMVIDAALFDYRVDTDGLNYDPFDSQGWQKVEVGDRISVSGQFDDSDFFDGPEIDATALTELQG